METSHKAVLKKFMSMLLLVALITSITGSALASSEVGQSQSCNLNVTRDGMVCCLDQAQIAVVDENGNIIQCQVSECKITKDKKGKIKSVTIKLRQVQTVSSSSTGSSSTAISSSDIKESQEAQICTTKDSASVSVNQMQCVLQSSNGVIKEIQIATIKVKFTKHGVKVIVKLKQKTKVR